LEENWRAFSFEIIYRKGNEKPSDFSNPQVINLTQIDNRQMEKTRTVKNGSDNPKLGDSMEQNVCTRQPTS
jgi:hypothetical protein